jgi:hypothetical protein
MTLTNSNLYLYGDLTFYYRLFDLINSKTDSNSKNSIKIDKSTKLNISTKYYETVIDLNLIENDLNKIEKDTPTDGLILYFDENNFKKLNFLEEFLKEKHLKLILIENLEKFQDKQELVDFSEENDFCLIDLSVKDEEENGVDELLNALYCHEWCCMNRNENTSSSLAAAPANSTNENVDEFENILLNLQDFRLKASKMESNQRKVFAQEIVTKFWNSIGGNGDELEGLSDLSDIE